MQSHSVGDTPDLFTDPAWPPGLGAEARLARTPPGDAAYVTLLTIS